VGSFIACHETHKGSAKGILQPNAFLIWVLRVEVDGWLEDAFDKIPTSVARVFVHQSRL